MATTERKYCQDCTFFSAEGKNEKRFGVCQHTGAAPSSMDRQYEYVSPEYAAPNPPASIMRMSRVPGDCGPDAIYYQAKVTALFDAAGGGLK